VAIKSDEISNLIKQRIKDFDVPVLSADVGIVTEIGDGIAQIYGLRNARSLELLEFKGGVRGMALNLEEDAVGAVILGPYGRSARATRFAPRVASSRSRWGRP